MTTTRAMDASSSAVPTATAGSGPMKATPVLQRSPPLRFGPIPVVSHIHNPSWASVRPVSPGTSAQGL